MSNLYSYGTSDLTLTEAIEKYSEYLGEAIALLYSPKSSAFAKLAQGKSLTDAQGNIINLDYQEHYIFEARIFNECHELRWLNESRGKGYAVLISELPYNFETKEEKAFLEKIPQQYLLWGERAKHHNSNGWLQLSTARIGSLNVPLPDDFRQGQRVYLKTVEYLAEVDDFGNVSVIDERLVKLEAK